MFRDDLKIIPVAVQCDVRQTVCSWVEVQTAGHECLTQGKTGINKSRESKALGGTRAKSPVQMPGQGTVTVHLIALDVCFYVTVAVQANRLENSRPAWISGVLFLCVQHGT